MLAAHVPTHLVHWTCACCSLITEDSLPALQASAAFYGLQRADSFGTQEHVHWAGGGRDARAYCVQVLPVPHLKAPCCTICMFACSAR